MESTAAMSHQPGEELRESWAFYSLWQLINNKLDLIMSAISDYVAKQNTHNANVDAAIGAVSTSVTGITGDIAGLNAAIAALQASQGAITPADQALLDTADAAGQALEDKVTAVAAALKALDDLTPPVAPKVP
jgi:peptidoglycan hydrolase CwlO-like protein